MSIPALTSFAFAAAEPCMVRIPEGWFWMAPNLGRITSARGEKVVGTSEAYNPQKVGFFLFPADGKSNNSRIFIVNKNVQKVKFL
jgi:hypothetical protein